MTIARSIIIAAVIVAIAAGAVAWLITPRYSLSNPGNGFSIRLDRVTGEMVGCREDQCARIDLSKTGNDVATPAPPPGFVPENKD